VFFVTQRQLQTAVDAAALAAVWYAPVCDSLDPAHTGDCLGTKPALPTPPAEWPVCMNPADCVANAVLQQNLAYTGALCRDLTPVPDGRTQAIGSLTYYIMTIDCDAPYWFARIFPGIPATTHIRAFARATIGYGTPTGVSPTPPTPPGTLVSRLVS
jgi:hypothetical protein